MTPRAAVPGPGVSNRTRAPPGLWETYSTTPPIRGTRKMPGQPDSAPVSCLSQSSVLAKRLFTTRTTQTPPARASTVNSVAIGGEPGAQPAASLVIIRGGSQAVTTERDSMPGPKISVTATGFPSRSSNSAGQNQDDIPGPVAMACHTSSGVPGTSTSTWIERRPEASFFTLMLSPWDRISAAEGAPRPPGDARGRPGRIQSLALARLRRRWEAFLNPRLPQRRFAGGGCGRL